MDCNRTCCVFVTCHWSGSPSLPSRDGSRKQDCASVQPATEQEKSRQKSDPKENVGCFFENIGKCFKIVHLCWRFALLCHFGSTPYTVNGILSVSPCSCLRETDELPAERSFLQFPGLWARICHFIPTMPGTESKPAWFWMKATEQSWLFPLAVLQTLIP